MTLNGDISPQERYDLIGKYLDDGKAEDISSFDLTGKSPLADYMIIATGRSSTHIKSLADNIQKQLSEAGIKGVRFEGQNMGDWIIVDAGDVLVHLFREEVRHFYELDKLWQECSMDENIRNAPSIAHVTNHKSKTRELVHV